jgi:hypothetical protein
MFYTELQQLKPNPSNNNEGRYLQLGVSLGIFDIHIERGGSYSRIKHKHQELKVLKFQVIVKFIKWLRKLFLKKQK